MVVTFVVTFTFSRKDWITFTSYDISYKRTFFYANTKYPISIELTVSTLPSSVFLIKPFVESQILENLVLRNGSEIFNRWKDPPVTPILYVRIFNLTNEDAFMTGSWRHAMTQNLRQASDKSKSSSYVFVCLWGMKSDLEFAISAEMRNYYELILYLFLMWLSSPDLPMNIICNALYEHPTEA